MRGRGMEYDESRPYQAGDDIRTLDWRVTARTGKPHTKLFREERERPVYLCVDLTRSMRFATRGVFKSVAAARAAALLGWKAQQSGDRVGGIVFNDQLHHEMEPGRGAPAVIRLLKQMTVLGALGALGAQVGESETSDKLSQLAHALERLKRLAKPGSLVFFLSDFRDLDDDAAGELGTIARHSDTYLAFIHDTFEATPPALAERAALSHDGEVMFAAFNDDDARRRVAERFAARLARFSDVCRNNRIHFTEIVTTDEPAAAVQRLLR